MGVRDTGSSPSGKNTKNPWQTAMQRNVPVNPAVRGAPWAGGTAPGTMNNGSGTPQFGSSNPSLLASGGGMGNSGGLGSAQNPTASLAPPPISTPQNNPPAGQLSLQDFLSRNAYLLTQNPTTSPEQFAANQQTYLNGLRQYLEYARRGGFAPTRSEITQLPDFARGPMSSFFSYNTGNEGVKQMPLMRYMRTKSPFSYDRGRDNVTGIPGEF